MICTILMLGALGLAALLIYMSRRQSGPEQTRCRFGATVAIVVGLVAAGLNCLPDSDAAEAVAREDLYQTAALRVLVESCLKADGKRPLRITILEPDSGPPDYLPKLEKLFGDQAQIKVHLKFKESPSPEELRTAFVDSGCDLVLVATTLPENAEDLQAFFDAAGTKLPAIALCLTPFSLELTKPYFASGQILCGVRTRLDYVHSDATPADEKAAFAAHYLLVEGQR